MLSDSVANASMNTSRRTRLAAGLYRGRVTRHDTSDRQIARVKLIIPSAMGELESAWAPVMSLFGGASVGAFSLPPIDSWVFVAFEMNDWNRPVVVGGLWNQVDNQTQVPVGALSPDELRSVRGSDTATGVEDEELKEPDDPAQPSYPNNRVLKTESGHLLEVDDTEDGERISITHKSGSWLEFHPDGSLVIGVLGQRYEVSFGNDVLHVKGDRHVVVDSEDKKRANSIAVETDDSYTVKSKGDMTLQSDDNVTIKSLVKTLLETVTAEIKAQNINLEATTEIKETVPKKTVDATTSIELKAPSVLLGGIAPGFVQTTLTHPIDFITGIPIPGTPVVQAG